MNDLIGLYDRMAISDKLARWCRIVDSRQIEALSEVFSNDIHWDFGGGTIEYNLRDVSARIDAHLGQASFCGKTHHHLSNIVIDLAGNFAESDAYFCGAHAGIGRNEGRTLVQWGIYRDSWERKTQGWRITRRIYRIDISDGPMEIVYGSAPSEMWSVGDPRRLNH